MARNRGRLTINGRPAYVGDWAPVWDAVMAGREPAESLPSSLRAALFRTLRAEGWTDDEVAAWTRTTLHVVWRQVGRQVVDTTPARCSTSPIPTALHRPADEVRSRT